MEQSTTTVLLVGVGGQGTILAAELLAQAALESGYDVKVSEIHGMAQRGGSVTTVVRFGDEVHSMVCDEGSADIIVAFETTEALRALPYLAEDGTLIASDESIQPMSVLTGKASMPTRVRERLADVDTALLDVAAIARQSGNPKTVNVALLGALSTLLPFSGDVWDAVVRSHVPPKTIEANAKAFAAGRAHLAERAQRG